MKTYIKRIDKYFLIAIFVLIGWCSLHFIYPYIIETILINIKWFLFFILLMCFFYFIKLIIEKDYIGIRNVLLTLLIIFLFIYFVPILSYQTKNLPNGTKIMMHRSNKQISFRPLDSETFYIINPSGDVIIKDMETNKELYSFRSIIYKNIYEYYFNIMKYN